MISDMAREAMERDRLLVQRKEKFSRITESMHATNSSYLFMFFAYKSDRICGIKYRRDILRDTRRLPSLKH